MQISFMSPASAASTDDSAPNRGILARIHLDTPLFMGMLTAAAVSLIVIYSAGREDLDVMLRQGIRLGIGFVAMFIIAQIHPRYLYKATPWIFLLGIGLLMAVLVVGESGKGAQRWLNLGVIRFQPSEIMRVGLPMMMAWYFSQKALPPKFVHLIVGALITLIPTLMIAKQPDLGTALLILSSGCFALFLVGLSWKIMATLAALAGMGAPTFWALGMHDYQRQRVLTFLNPESDPLGSGYHIIQSKIAIGSGGIYGKGWLNGTQSHLEFLPERTTDFIFAVMAEEFGFIGLCLLLGLYFFIIARSLYIAAQSHDTFSRILAGSLGLTFFVYVFVNAGMVIGLLPVVGLPLPMISYGGTSLVTIMAGFGMLMSVYSHRRTPSP